MHRRPTDRESKVEVLVARDKETNKSHFPILPPSMHTSMPQH